MSEIYNEEEILEFQKGAYKEKKINRLFFYRFKKVLKKILTRLIQILLPFIAIFILVLKVFIICKPNNFEIIDAISLGSIFVTFSSAIIAIISIYEGNLKLRFLSNLEVLYKELINKSTWIRWTFIKNKIIHIHGKHKLRYLSYPCFILKYANKQEKIYIPSDINDFNFFQIASYHKRVKLFILFYDEFLSSDAYVTCLFKLTCMGDTYKKMLLHRLMRYVNCICIMIILSGLICSFESSYIISIIHQTHLLNFV